MRKVVGLDVPLDKTVVCVLERDGTLVGRVKWAASPAHRCKFADRIREFVAGKPMLGAAIDPLLCSAEVMATERKAIDRRLEQAARRDDVCLRLMTIPGVGPITSLAFRATVDDPARFDTSKSVGALMGLTPRVYQSGETDRSGHMAKAGDDMMRHLL